MAIPILQGFSVRSANAVDNRTVVNARSDRNAIDAARLYNGLVVYLTSSEELWLLRDKTAFVAALPSATTDAGWTQIQIGGGGGMQFADQQALEDFITDKAGFRENIGVSDQHIPNAAELLDQVDRSNQPSISDTDIIAPAIRDAIQDGELRSDNDFNLSFPTTTSLADLAAAFPERLEIALSRTIAAPSDLVTQMQLLELQALELMD